MASRKRLRVRLPEFPEPSRIEADDSSPLSPVIRFYFDAGVTGSGVAAIFRHLLGGVKEKSGRYTHALPATHPKYAMAYCEYVEVFRRGEELEVVATYSHSLHAAFNDYLVRERNHRKPDLAEADQ